MAKQKFFNSISLVLWLMVSASASFAQTNFSFYSMEKHPNAALLNPAFLVNQSKLNFSIFPVSGVNIGYNNQQVIKDISSNMLSGNQATDKYRNVFNSMIKLNLFIQKAEVNLLNFGYKSKLGSFDFRMKENVQLISDVNSEFAQFITDNNSQTLRIGEQESFPAFEVHFREFSLGYARKFHKLSIGARAKLYYGKSAIFSNITGASVIRNQDDVYLQMYGDMKVSLPINIELDRNSLLRTASLTDNFSVVNYLTNTGNSGLGLDFGFSYQASPALEISASVVDLGYISWKSNLNSMKFNGEYLFPKEYLISNENGVITRNTSFSFETVDIRQLYKISPDNSSFKTWLPVNIYGALKYNWSDAISLAVVNRFVSAKSMNFNTTAATVLYNLNERLSLNAGYVIIGNDFMNVPFNLLYSAAFGQFYVGTDNILSFFGSNDSGFMGATFGMKINLFRNKEKYKKQLEYLPFYRVKKTRPD